MQQNINANTEHGDFDADNDGRLTHHELAAACNITIEEALECVNQYDEDGDGTLDAAEFNNLKEQILAQQMDEMTNKLNANDLHENIDADGDGKLSAAELAEQCNISELEAQNIILQYDQDGDGQLNPQEFEDLKQQILSQQNENMTDKLAHNDYHDQIDADGDGKLSAAELAQACNISELEAQNIILQYDEDGDGQLNQDEFENLKQQILSQQRDNMTDKLGANQEFDDLDANSDKKLSAKELAEACNISELQASNIIQQYDQDADGLLDKEEFEILKAQVLEQQRDKASAAINEYSDVNAMDDNKDGKVSAYELAQATGITQKEAELLIQQYDDNGDGYLQPDEFEKLKAKILEEQEQKRRLEQQQRERQQRQQEQQNQYGNNDSINPNEDKPQEFKHKWKFGMNFDPKNENVVIYISDEITEKNWGITLTKQNFDGAIRQEYRKLGGVISNGSIKYDYPQNGGPLGVNIEGKNGEKYVYSCAQQY
mmetsp:Transcript_7279/g.6520  ORF Transcript_7279/g.6520 Transcript_7279/m.6520 type:complete len:488 (-) Transcript_7279:31-1494(-)|eukprot:CAMPEP_0201564226 /NCGR_PEP_ID=MMETSP0190_2-20130828/2273_1 /ASSEMBLY_ACC=CAM_ASM_000263 /TAXON_ID=37353 /ORGANISM="Rosalina sp." /LENGTH=487 /DNA_ID=CAMNT_0047980091 /DNA_START=176 /DNA_END=1639 /DNA_ORIENTATION=-